MKKVKNSTGVGRPQYVPVIPRGNFTFADLCEANGVNVKTGKGKNCSALTLRKFIARDADLGKKSILELTDELAEPNNKKGLGRKSFLYARRAGATVPKATVKAETKSARKVSVKVPAPAPTADYEAQKAALGIGATPAPTAEVNPTPEPAPTAETPAAPVAEPAPAA